MEQNYATFKSFLFDRDESKGDWRFDIDLDEPQLSGEEVVEYVRRMLENCEAELTHYTDWQLAMGVEYIFNNSCSDLSFYLRDGPASIEKRIEAINALKNFFQRCLNPRCKQSLGHLSEEGNQLNHFCYMLWDVTPLTYCEETKNKGDIYSAIADVMEYSLYLDNIACIESGLHGLGHLELYYKKSSKIVRAFIKSGAIVDSRLIQYSKNAETGYVQ